MERVNEKVNGEGNKKVNQKCMKEYVPEEKMERNYSESELMNKALEAMRNAYTPYSHFNVGAALLAASGRIYLGCNVENASYGATICAERTALVKAISEGEREFVAIAIVCGARTRLFPCGICRQFLSEFGDMDVLIDGSIEQNAESVSKYTVGRQILCENTSVARCSCENTAPRKVEKYRLSELLPCSFQARHIHRNENGEEGNICLNQDLLQSSGDRMSENQPF